MLYCGRFAPSPSGPLHFGSLVCALASYLDAKHEQGLWKLRIEDLDTFRNMKHADSQILHVLEAYHLFWDGDVIYQSQRIARYEEICNELLGQNLAYRCQCSRKFLRSSAHYGQYGLIYPEHCRKATITNGRYSIRIKTNNDNISINDRIVASKQAAIRSEMGDFIIKRSDHIFAYHFSVVIDDYDHKINHIVRGQDLYHSTFQHSYLNHLLGYPIPQYKHIPVVLDKAGKKLSKQTFAEAISIDSVQETLIKALLFLKQTIPQDKTQMSISELLDYASKHWNYRRLNS